MPEFHKIFTPYKQKKTGGIKDLNQKYLNISQRDSNFSNTYKNQEQLSPTMKAVLQEEY